MDLILSNKDIPENKKLFFIDQRIFDSLNIKDKEKLNYKIGESFDYSREQRLNSFNQCKEIFDSILIDLSDQLNFIHNQSFSQTAWHIILGHWLYRMIFIIYNRDKKLNEAINKNNFKNIHLLNTDEYNFAAFDSINAAWESQNSEWNHAIFSELYRLSHKREINEIILPTLNKGVERQTFEDLFPEKFKNKCKLYLFKIFKFFKKNNDALIYQSGLDFFSEKKLEICLKQFPQVWPRLDIHYEKFDKKLRNKLNFNYENFEGLEKKIRYLIPKLIPNSAIESFHNVMSTVSKMNFPQNPKFIFTSYAHTHDEVFKFFAAKKIDEGVSYFVGQHGGNYFTQIDNDLLPEFNTCSKFFSWGRSLDNNQKNIVNFNYKVLNKSVKPNKKGNLLVVCRSLGHEQLPYDRYIERKKNSQAIIDLTKMLSKEIISQTKIRIHKSYKFKRNLLGEKLINFFKSKNLNIDYGKKSLHKEMSNSRLIYLSYDGTPLLENLNFNFPTVCYWPNTFNHLNPKFDEIYQILIDAKILFLDQEDLVRHINRIWKNVDEWWESDFTQNKINEFTSHLSLIPPKKPIQHMSSILLKTVNNFDN